MTLPELFAATFANRAGETALEFGSGTYTFGELDARASRLAGLLSARGFCAGDRLAVYLENRVEFIDLFLACSRLGVILVPINILYRDREASHIVADAEPKAIVASGPVPGGFGHWDVAELSGAAAERSVAPADLLLSRLNRGGESTDSTPAAIVYTSGTTGTAKGAVLTHGNFAANATGLLDAWRITSADRFLLPLPLFHVHGLGNGLCCWLASGCRMRLLERFDSATAVGEFDSFQPTLFFGVPTIYVRLLGLSADDAAAIGERMRLFVSGSAPLAAHVFEEFKAKYGHAILERYGMTETFMNISNPYDGERRPGTVGKPLPGVSVRIVSSAGDDVPEGEEGQLLVRGPNVFAGYWRRPDATAGAFTNLWFKTGDIGRLSKDGYITLCGRMGDVIISGGFNIYPREIEDVLSGHPAVAMAAIIGVPDEKWGEAVKAVVVLRAGADASADELVQHVRSIKGPVYAPKSVDFVDAFPFTSVGKVDKRALRSQYWLDSERLI